MTRDGTRRRKGSAVNANVLLVDDDPGLLRTIQLLLEDEAGFRVTTATSGETALQLLERTGGFDVVVSDVAMPGMDGIRLLEAIRERHPRLPVILITAYASVRSAVAAMRAGAFQYLAKPVDPDELLLQVERALDASRLETEHRDLRDRTGDPGRFDTLVGSSAVMERLRNTISRLAAVNSTVLIRGETGVGKELVARLIHNQSPRRVRPFVVVNCTAIPGELIESELFGHEKGAFTGATTSRCGRIEDADGGTLLLDEIGDMPVALQPKLLRFLQEGTVQRVGGRRERRVDVRILAATHRDLEKAIVEGAFREDLYHRLDTIPVRVPPLREHLEDLPELVDHLVAKICRRLRRAPVRVLPGVLETLTEYTFPGNVRELENLLERSIVLSPEPGILTEVPIPAPRRQERSPLDAIPLENGFRRLMELTEEAELALIRRAMAAWPGLSHAKIAERLGTTRRILETRLRRSAVTTGPADR